MSDEYCLHPDHRTKKVRSRGLCATCYSAAIRAIKSGKTTWENLQLNRKCTPARVRTAENWLLGASYVPKSANVFSVPEPENEHDSSVEDTDYEPDESDDNTGSVPVAETAATVQPESQQPIPIGATVLYFKNPYTVKDTQPIDGIAHYNILSREGRLCRLVARHALTVVRAGEATATGGAASAGGAA